MADVLSMDPRSGCDALSGGGGPLTRAGADTEAMMALMTRLWPLHRTLVSADMDRAMDIIAEALPAEGEWVLNAYPSGTRAWTWTVPEEFVVDEAHVELLTPEGPRRIVDFADNPLHVVSYSPAFTGELSFDELAPHLHYNRTRPHAVPWVFKYYSRDWGFCLPYERFQELPRDGRYRVVMRTRFEPGRMKVGEYTLPGESGDFLLIVCAVCHPMQVNDSISGVVAAVDFARRAAARPGRRMGIKLLFVPETIGTIAWLAADERRIERCRYGVFSEFIGHDHPLRLQRTRQDDHLLDRMARHALARRTAGAFVEGPYCHTIITNDEKVTNAPGVDIPTIALNRWPDDGWPLYHTDDDRPEAMLPDKLAEVSLLYDDLFHLIDSNVYPRRTFRGPLFLSGVDFGFDWLATRALKRGVQDIALALEGDLSAFDIALKVGLDYDLVLRVLAAMARQGFVTLSHAPWRAA